MQHRPQCHETDVVAWITARLPAEWFVAPPEARADRDEILLTVTIDPAGHEDPAACIAAFREATRQRRMEVADAAQERWARVVSWAARCGDVEERFTTASVPVMTRLRIDERQVLDTLVDAGVARSRADALAWCVRQVGLHQQEWMDRLREAVAEVERIRADGPPGG